MKKLPIVRWFDDLKSALSIYIAGNVAPNPNGVTAGKFYFWKGKLRLPTSNISAGETLTDSNMPVVPEGGLNKIKDSFDVISGNATLENVLKAGSVVKFEKTNHVVVGNISIYPTSALDVNTLLASGLPLPRSAVYFTLGNTNVIRVVINASGQLKTDGNISTANLWYNGIFCYLTEAL